LKVKLIICS